MKLQNEEQIVSNWQNSSSPLVSVCCISYNHETYIEEAIQSFLMQKTDFPFEILIDDDCSQDDTPKIIDYYFNKYPRLIKPLLRKKNVGSMCNFFSNLQRATGKYVAICEGDDYWTDSNKLQKQVKMMEQHPNIGISFHCAMERVDEILTRKLAKHADKSKIFSTKEMILGNGDFCPTASLMIYRDILNNLPQWLIDVAPVGDYYLQVLSSVDQGALYIDECMSVYRRGHDENWTSTQREEKKRLLWLEKTLNALEHLNEDTKSVYELEVQTIKCQSRWTFIRNKNFSFNAREKQYIEAFRCLSLRRKLSGLFKLLIAFFRTKI